MKLSPLDIGVTLALVACFVAVGETVLWRRSRDLFSWNESFLVGAGVCATGLFPLSILSPHGALHTMFALMVCALIVILAREFLGGSRSRLPAPSERFGPRTDPVALALFAGIILVAAGFAALNFRYSFYWDGFQIWATKAQMLDAGGGLSREWYPEDAYDSRILGYPPLIPLQEALLSVGRGGFDFDALKPVFLTFYVSMLLSTFRAARAAGSRRTALAATLLLALLPAASTGTAAGGYADVPQAAFVAGVVAVSSRFDAPGVERSPLPWLIGSLTTVKPEGILLAGVACLGVLGFWWMERPRRLFARALSSWRGIAIVAAFLGVRIVYVRWLGLHDTTYGPLDAAHFERARAIVGSVIRLCLQIMADPIQWGFFWPAFVVACVILAVRGTNRDKCIAFATAAGIIIDTSIFLFTNWSPELQISQAYPRLLLQLAPAAAVVIGTAYVRALPRLRGEGQEARRQSRHPRRASGRRPRGNSRGEMSA